ncbi:hemicentin-1-like [Thunnus maccoyii]|uniref:hemicentin-1-like n=1 Tax=Thunnus maccoyii TaxID=8240 RepID=UPI001C4B7EDE|nr:hemicentin-1-like [Thunnus maccoyii]
MESPVVFIIFLTTISFATDHVCSNRIYASENPLPVGSNVTLFSEATVTTGSWQFNNNMIVLMYPGNVVISNAWKNRTIFNSTSSSLAIMSVQLEDSGLYTLQEINSFHDQLTLSVQVPISNVTLRANATNLVEFNHTAVLICSVSNGSSLSYMWLKGSSVVTAGGGVQFSDGGSTLTIARVTRYDEGPFRCNVSNGVSQEISLPVHLNISYGPSNTTMTIRPMKHAYRTGSNIALTCSAESNPPAMIQWMVGGVSLNQSGPQLHLQNVTKSDSGNYICQFYNKVTSRFSSASAMIRIEEPIAAAVVNHTGGPAIHDEPFTLHCEVTGSVDYIQWWRNGQLISADNTTVFDMGNKTLILHPVQMSDGGDYQCQALNAVSNMTSSPYTVEVNYGPMTTVITGPSVALTGTLVTLNCSSNSHPRCHFSWYFNGSLVATTSEYQIGPLTLNMSGKYICMAYNNITRKNSTAYKMLTVLVPVTMASIKIAGPQPILNHTFSLICETAGDVESIMWMHLGLPLYADNRRNFSTDNTILTFDPVMFSDNGNYKCSASNPLSSLASDSFMLKVIYGPEMPTITGPSVAKIGHSVTLNCSASSYPHSLFKWYFNNSLVANTSEYVTPPLTTDMSGTYTCMANNHITGQNSSDTKTLTVFEPIKDVKIETSMNPAIEGHSYKLTCNVTGPAEHVDWMKNGKPLHADNRTVFYIDNKTVSFKPLERDDTGDYQCMAINPVENMTSETYMLLVNYGPDIPTITGPSVAKIGHSVTLNCSASSYPHSLFKWYFNNSLVANTSEYVTPPLTTDMSGTYTCMANNHITGQNSSDTKTLTVFEPIKDVKIETSMNPAIEGRSYKLTCNVTGPAEHVDWMKNGKPLHADNRTVFYMDNKTVSFKPLERDDTGDYQCMAINPVENMTSETYMLLVNFGPETPIIYGPSFAEMGHYAVFNCSTVSVPTSNFSWWFNGSLLANTAVFTADHLSLNMSGEYTCIAYNYVTGKNSTNSTMLTVIKGIESVMVKNNTVPINFEDFTLTCEVIGPYTSISWMINTSIDNKLLSYNMLNFTPVTLNNDGTYRCIATDKAGSHESPEYKLLVNYGPFNVSISGPDSAKVGHIVTLKCSTDSRPDCDFHWFLNNQPSAVETGSVITFKASKEKAGSYKCKARNPVTNITMYKTKAFTLTAHASALHFSSQSGLMLMVLFASSLSTLFH